MAEPQLERPISLLQITLVVHDLAAIVSEFQDRLGLAVAFRDPGVAQFGLANAVLPLGTTFIEILSPLPSTRPEETAGGRHLARQGGDGGYMVILQVDDLESWRTPLAQTRTRIAWEGNTSDTLHGADWAGFHLHPRDTGGMMISLDRPDPPDSWAGAGPDWRNFIQQGTVDGLRGISLSSPSARELGARWASVLGRSLESDSRIALDQGEILFRDGATEKLESVTLHAVDSGRSGEKIVIGGVSFLLAD